VGPFSRRVIGWALERSLEDSLVIAALAMALRRRSPPPGLVDHSDRGSRYASKDYTALPKANHIEISMSRKGNPYDCVRYSGLAHFDTLIWPTL
jgi:transposase InsO family protein